MKIFKRLTFILIVFIFYSCNTTKREAITQLGKDFLIIKESQSELVKNYDKCLSVFAHRSEVSDGYKRVFCNLSYSQSAQLEELNLIMTKRLIDMGYKISLDAVNYYRVFYQIDTKEYIAGILRYGILYSNITFKKDSIYSLDFGKIDTLKQVDTYNNIIEVNEYFE